jgi:hypothetical protein
VEPDRLLVAIRHRSLDDDQIDVAVAVSVASSVGAEEKNLGGSNS